MNSALKLVHYDVQRMLLSAGTFFLKIFLSILLSFGPCPM
jgi:hypothetical protein